jgi:hypothetical protein
MVRIEEGGGEGDCRGCGDAPQKLKRLCFYLFIARVLKGPPFET